MIASYFEQVYKRPDQMGLGPCESPYLRSTASKLNDERTQIIGEWIQPGVRCGMSDGNEDLGIAPLMSER